MRVLGTRWTVAATAAATSTLGALACLGPTEIDVRVSTDLDCATVSRFGFSISGAPLSAPITTARECSASSAEHILGNLVVTPSGSRDEVVSVTVALGVTRDSESCAAANYDGCIVARRRVRFSEHHKLDLPIALTRSCLNVPCDALHSCAAGRCASATVDDKDFCTGPDCPWSGDASPPTACASPSCALTRARPRDSQGFGIAASATTLYWAELSGVYSLPLDSVANLAVTPTPVPFAANNAPFTHPRGVAVGTFGADTYVAATNELDGVPAYARQVGTDSTVVGFSSTPPAYPFGLALVPPPGAGGRPSFAMSYVSTNTIRPNSNYQNAPPLTISEPAYLESNAGLVFVAHQNGISTFSPEGDPARVALEDAGAVPGEYLLGVAVGARAIYVSTMSGKLLALDRVTRATIPFPGGTPSLPSPHDLAIVARAGGSDLYVAAGDGIYVARGLE